MKVGKELIHEMGHAFFVWMFGGHVVEISISLLWPFRLSYTKWEMIDPSNTQLALIASAGILVETLASIVGQSILLSRKGIHTVYEISLFWLSFWAYLSSVVYLVIGAVFPFGDILDLIRAVPVSRLWIGSAGVALLVSNTYSLSIILKDIFSRFLRQIRASEAVSYFWVFLHTFFVLITIAKYGLPTPPTIALTVLLLMFIWSYFFVRWSLVIVSRLRGSRETMERSRWIKPRLTDLSVESRVLRRKLKLGYVALFSVALMSTLLTGYMINQYVATYRLIMKTGIEIDVTYFELDQEPVMNLSVKVVNPGHDNLMLSRIEFDVHLNQRFMVHQVLRQIPVVDPESQVTFNHVLTLPLDRMFTVEQALKEGRWEWKISGSGHVETLFGETLLRFKSVTTLKPQEG